MAIDRGWQPEPGQELDWDSTITMDSDRAILDSSWVEGKEIIEPEEWEPVKELTTCLETLFGTDENVGYDCAAVNPEAGEMQR